MAHIDKLICCREEDKHFQALFHCLKYGSVYKYSFDKYFTLNEDSFTCFNEEDKLTIKTNFEHWKAGKSIIPNCKECNLRFKCVTGSLKINT